MESFNSMDMRMVDRRPHHFPPSCAKCGRGISAGRPVAASSSEMVVICPTCGHVNHYKDGRWLSNAG